MSDIDSSSTEIQAVGVNGCSGVFIWTTDKLWGLHADAEDLEKDIGNLEEDFKTESKVTDITDVAVSSPSDTVVKKVEALLKWTGKKVEPHTYPYTGSGKNEFTLTATFAEKGKIEATNDPKSKSASESGGGSSGKGSPKSSNKGSPKSSKN